MGEDLEVRQLGSREGPRLSHLHPDLLLFAVNLDEDHGPFRETEETGGTYTHTKFYTQSQGVY